MLDIDNKHWRKMVQLNSLNQYTAPSTSGKKDRVVINNQIVQVNFENPKNLREYIDRRSEQMKSANQDRIGEIKEKLNGLINQLYDDIAKKALEMDRFRIPVYGIPEPSLENPVNMFQRQIKIEQLSFELAHSKYKSSLTNLMKVGKADQMATSHRYILEWTKTLETAIAEQQQIFVH